MVHPTYTYGTNKYVFFKTKIENHDDRYLDKFASLVKSMQDYVTDREKYFLFIINPTKIYVYQRYLPKGYNFTNYRVKYLKKKLDEMGVNYIDNSEYLSEISQTKQVYNVKYDAGHWNELGAFYGINNIYNKLREDGFDISSLQESEYKITSELKTTLPVSEFPINEEVPLYTLINTTFNYTDKYNNYIDISQSHNTYIESIDKDSYNNYNLLFFRGSYMGGKEKFICNKFSKTFLIHNYDNSINFDYYCNVADPDIVLFETVEYALGEGYYKGSEIVTKKYNPVYSKHENLVDGIIQNNIDIEPILNLINSNMAKDITLTKLNLDENNLAYAYLKVENDIYDFCHDNAQLYIALDTELLADKSIKLILISEDLKTKQVINIK